MRNNFKTKSSFEGKKNCERLIANLFCISYFLLNIDAYFFYFTKCENGANLISFKQENPFFSLEFLYLSLIKIPLIVTPLIMCE